MRSSSIAPNLQLRPLFLALLVPMLACSGVVSAPDEGPGAVGSGPGVPGGAGSGGGAGVATGGTGGVTATGGAGGSSVPEPDAIDQACARTNGALNVGLTPARRLTRDQFNNTVRDLLGIQGNPAGALAPDERIGPFESNAVAPIDETLVQQHQEVAASLAKAAEPRMKEISPCDLAVDTGTTCASRFVTEFGRRAYRRPLEAGEVTKYVSLYALGRQESAPVGFRLVLEAMLQSPFFLYHHDVGVAGTPKPGAVPVGPYELAARLSYFIWNSMPDDQLATLAGNGTIADNTVLGKQVERMVNDPRASETIAHFHQQWLGIDDLVGRNKNATLYPRYSEAVATAALQETAKFTDYVIRSGDGLLKTLLTSPVVFPDGELFGVYGLTKPANFVAGTQMSANPMQRSGILTQAAFLTRQAHADQSSPVHRGVIVREHLLCQTIPPPPPEVNTTPPAFSPATSTRERFAQHEADAVCASCHRLMDPIGLTLEHYDAVGAYREKDGLGPVDARGEVLLVAAGSKLAGPVNGAIELAAKLVASKEVSDCVANQWFRYSMGRMESTDDACSMKGIHDGFRSTGGNIRSLLANIALSPAFRNVRTNGG